MEKGKLVGLIGTYVDDSLLAGTHRFLTSAQKSLKYFDSRTVESNRMAFSGITIISTTNGFKLSQLQYHAKLNPLPQNASFELFASRRAQFAWMMHTRPDSCFAISMSSQVTTDKYDKDSILFLNRAIKHVRANPSELFYPKLDLCSLHLRTYADASFATNPDGTSQLGYIVLLCDERDLCAVLHYSSFKARRVTRSILGAEVYAFTDAFDCAFSFKHDLQKMLNKEIPLRMFTDSKCFFDVITKNSTMSEKRLLIDVQVARQAYERMEITEVGLITTDTNPADSFTKITKSYTLTSIIK